MVMALLRPKFNGVLHQVVLTKAEVRMLEWVGKQRYASAVSRDRDPGDGPSRDDHSATNHIRGAKCEFAGSLILNLSWRPTIGEVRERDIGGLVDTRSTDLADGRLIIKPKDKDFVPFMLMLIEGDEFVALGWMFAGEAKQRFPLLTKFGDPAHFADQSALLPIEMLSEWIRNGSQLPAKNRL